MRTQIVIYFLLLITISFAQNVGINESSPNAALDVKGDVIFQRNILSLQNGQNDNVDITTNKFSFYEVSNVTNAFQISGFNGGIDGKILIVHNPTVHNMTLQNLHGGSLIANQIFTGASGDIIFSKGESVILAYTALSTHWVVISRYTQGSCPPGMVNCSGSCVSINIDPMHCGSCGNVCPFGAQCYNGVCTLFGCPVGFGNCNGNSIDGCEVNLLNNNNHCGTCGNVCNFPNSTSTCVSGVCVLTCNMGYLDCNGLVGDGCESFIATDPNNCGACGNVCTFPNAVGFCIGGVCGMTCDPGFADCNNNMTDGCEVDLQSDLMNCGGCGITCPSYQNGSPTCTGGSCNVICDNGFSNCNMTLTDGCETNILTDVNNCGSCGITCFFPNSIESCVNGNCFIAGCEFGWANCNNIPGDGCEINILTNANNCGACGIVCSLPNATSQCVNGTCQIASCSMGFSDCNGIATDGCECNLTCVNGNCQ